MNYQYLKDGIDDNLPELERLKKVKYTIRRMYMQTVNIHVYRELKNHLGHIDDKIKELNQTKYGTTNIK